MAKLEISLTLDQRQLDWLQNMADKYSLPTADKALRIVILFTKRGKEFNQTIFKERDGQEIKNGVTGKHAVDKVHDDYLEEVVTNYKLGGKDQAVQIIVDYAISHIDEKTLFEVKLCKHGDTCKHCTVHRN
ncbi:unnamed protein product [Calypogeia fissa]